MQCYCYNKMLENEQSPKNSTQLRIIKLLDELNIEQSNIEKRGQTKASSQFEQLISFREQARRTFQNLNQKVDTAVSVIAEVQKQKRELNEYKRKLRMTAQFQQTIEDAKKDSKQFYETLSKEAEERQKIYVNKIMETKIKNVEFYENSKHETNFYETEVLPRQLERTRKNYLKGSGSAIQQEPQLMRKIKTLKKNIEEDQLKNKMEIKKIKNNILEVFERIQEDLEVEQQQIDKSFALHFETLQKIVASVSDKID